MTFKLVNTFNGRESEERYNFYEEAEAVKRGKEKAFYGIPGNQNSKFCVSVVDESLEWQFDHVKNRFAWS